MVIEYYGTVEDIRELSGVGKSLQDFSNEDIEKHMAAGKDIIDGKTGKTNWSSTDAQFELILQIEGNFAAAFALMRGNASAKAEGEKYYAMAKDLLDILTTSTIGDTSDSDVKIAVTEYESYPLALEENPDAEPYMSTRSMRWS